MLPVLVQNYLSNKPQTLGHFNLISCFLCLLLQSLYNDGFSPDSYVVIGVAWAKITTTYNC